MPHVFVFVYPYASLLNVIIAHVVCLQVRMVPLDMILYMSFLRFCLSLRLYLFFICICLCDRKIGERNKEEKMLLTSPSKIHSYFVLCIVVVKIHFFLFLYKTTIVEPSVISNA